MADENTVCFVLVRNIPARFHSVDLRSFFSQFLEAGKFDCFHFRHRPEVLKQDKVDSEESVKGKTTCCVVRLMNNNVGELLQCYNNENWIDKNGKLNSMKAVISPILIKDNDISGENLYQSNHERRTHKRDCVEFVKSDLLKLSELKPPSFMPNGNIGTTLKTFLNLIRTCQLPPQVIKKLGLVFPGSRSNRRYGNVAYNYEADNDGDICAPLSQDIERRRYETRVESTNDRDDESSEESEGEEDWERHETLHDDVDCQARTKERLFENEIELKWEKGGSGLVFYTDAAYWNTLNGDFDEQTADDWDIDMGVYEKEGRGDRHSEQLLQMRLEEERRKSCQDEDLPEKIGSFEKHTKGFAGKLMKNQGWKVGDSLGSSQPGITEPVPNDGQHPHCKTGLGYYGEKLVRNVKRRHVDKEVMISTIYDNHDHEPKSTPYKHAGPYTMKYRNKVKFVQGKGK